MSPSTLLCLAVLAALIGAWAYWPTVFWPPFSEDEQPEPEPELPPLPEPRFAWREKAYAGRRVVSPMFHSPRAAGRWAAEHGVYLADDDVLRLTFCEIVDGVEYRAKPEDATKALLEALERSPEAAA